MLEPATTAVNCQGNSGGYSGTHLQRLFRNEVELDCGLAVVCPWFCLGVGWGLAGGCCGFCYGFVWGLAGVLGFCLVLLGVGWSRRAVIV